MEDLKPRGEVAVSNPKSHENSQLPMCVDLTSVPATGHKEGATEDENAIDGPHTTNVCDATNDTIKVAQAAIGASLNNQKAPSMESIKALLRNFLDDVEEARTERSSYFNGLLSQWLDIWRRDRTHSLLIYILGDHTEQYGNRMLGFDNLETTDKIKTRVLEQECWQQGVGLYLAKLTSAINLDPDNALNLKMAISLHDICDLSGGQLSNKPVTVGRESVLQSHMLQERYNQTIALQNPYPSPIEGTPSRQIDTAMSFQDWVLLIMPKGYQFRFLTENADPEALHDWIKTQSADLHSSETDLAGADPNIHWGLALACKIQLNNIGTSLASSSGIGRQFEMAEAIVCASLRLRDPQLFRNAVALDPRMLSLTVWEKVGNMLEVAQFFSYQNSLSEALTKIDSFQDRYIILCSICEGCEAQNEPQEHMKSVYSWIRDQVDQALNEIERVEENDGAILVLVLKRYAKEITMNRIVSFAKKHSSNQAFAIEFAFSLHDELAADTMDARSAKHALAEILSAIVPVLCVRDSDTCPLLNGPSSSASAGNPTQDQQALQAERMARLVRCSLTVGLYAEEHALLRQIWLGASLADASSLQHVFLPYLKKLLGVMQDHLIPPRTQTYQWQFQQIVSLFITRYIGKEPTPLPTDFTCPPLGCAISASPYGCPTCLELDAFLVDPHQKIADVTGSIDTPEHIRAQIQGTDYLQMTVMSHSAEHMRSTIRITKNMTKTAESDPRHDAWKERVIKANDLIQAVCGDEQWKMLLGDRYEECMELRAIRAG